MPTYDYHCTDCGHKFEITQKITAEPLKECPDCSKKALRRGPGGGIGVQFRGSGFYQTDYCCGNSCESADQPKDSSCGCHKGGCCCKS